MTQPISAVITTFNRASIVPDAIGSVREQIIPVTELIVVDDGSADDTETTVRAAFDGAEISCSYIRKTNGGMASALNRGISASTGEWIAFLDDDDLWNPTHIARCIEIAQQFPAIGCITGLREENGSLQRPPDKLLGAFDALTPDRGILVKRQSVLTKPFFTPVVGTAMVRRKLLEKIRFESDAGARLDIHFFWRLSELTDIALDMQSHGVARQYRTSFLSTDEEAPHEIKDRITLRRNLDEVRMLRLLLGELPEENAQEFRKLYQSALIGRSYLLRQMNKHSEGLRWLLSNRSAIKPSSFLKEAILCLLKSPIGGKR